MYRHCIYCAADLGGNEALEGFPVGRTVAFDAARGRLWAVCGRCARWNLAPIEARWEPVEAAERRFRDTGLRVQAENIGVAKLADGTQLVRIGAALPGEVAVWRYGGEVMRRRRRWLAREHLSGATAAAASAAVLATVGPLGSLLTIVGGFWAAEKAYAAVERRMERLLAARADRRPVHRLDGGTSPTGEPLVVRQAHLRGAFLALDDDGGVALRVPALSVEPYAWLAEDGDGDAPAPLTVRGGEARALLARALVGVNAPGATPRVMEYVLDVLETAPSPEAYLARLAEQGTTLELPRGAARDPARWDAYWKRRAELEAVPPAARDEWRARASARIAGEAYGGLVRALALEVALHQADERRALEGELALLRAAWREAEEIARIADALAGAVHWKPRAG